VNEEISRDPYNNAVAKVLNDAFEAQDFGEARLVRATGISRSTLRRYLSGERDIRVAELRKIAAALRLPVSKILSEAERSLKKRD
jgi:transcriptional regulator with XRE-family HTH domain